MKIGIITFHGSHNYGSVLQAYATQETIKKLGYQSEIINFRMKSQKEFYTLYTRRYGKINWICDRMMFPLHFSRKARAEKFESFITNNLILSDSECSNYQGLKRYSNCYDLYISGSDQIWSNRVPEIARSETDYTGVYFLDFVNDDKPRISYASSVGEITYDELKEKGDLIDKYSYISTREQYGVDLLQSITNKKVEFVCDPTLLLSKKDWISNIKTDRIIKEKYVLLYTLHGLKHGSKWAKHLSKFAKRNNLKFVCLAPFFPIVDIHAINVINIGPKEFINLINNAEIIFTDSFHGTAFSINLGKPFYSFTGKKSKDNRKLGILRYLGIEDRALERIEDIDSIRHYDLDVERYSIKLEKFREKSTNYLNEAIENSIRG